MGNIGWLKRALPFFATFGLGLFIASFFVSISPRFEHHERGRCHRDMWEMRIENEQLRDANKQLREQLDSVYGVENGIYPVYEDQDLDSQSVDEPVLPIPPPPAVKSHKVHIK